MDHFLPWLILLSPLCSAALILLFAHRSKPLSVFISLSAVFVSFLATLAAFGKAPESLASQLAWIDLGPALQLNIGYIKEAILHMKFFS